MKAKCNCGRETESNKIRVVALQSRKVSQTASLKKDFRAPNKTPAQTLLCQVAYSLKWPSSSVVLFDCPMLVDSCTYTTRLSSQKLHNLQRFMVESKCAKFSNSYLTFEEICADNIFHNNYPYNVGKQIICSIKR